MTDKIAKKDLERLQNMDNPIPEGCEDAVKFFLELDADVFWATCIAVITRMTKDNSFRLKEIIAEMMEGYPKELEGFKEIEAQFDEYFSEMDAKVASITSLDIEETDEP